MYEELLNTIINLAADRQKVLRVQTIVSDAEEAWLLAVERIVSSVHFYIRKKYIIAMYIKNLLI